MKTIGMLGGMSWESSVECERLMIEKVRRRLGPQHSPDRLIDAPIEAGSPAP